MILIICSCVSISPRRHDRHSSHGYCITHLLGIFLRTDSRLYVYCIVMHRWMLVVLPFCCAAMQFSPPQLIGPGGAACYFLGLNNDNNSRLVLGNAGNSVVVSVNGRGPWIPQTGANMSALTETYPFPSECRGCSSVETLGALEGVLID